MHTGKKIRLLRNIKGFTQEELAKKINKTRALLSHIEQTGKVNHYTLTAILKALNISLTDFEAFNGNEVLKGTAYPIAANEELTALKDKMEHYQKENNLLKELVDSQKKVIDALENKKKEKQR